MRNITNHVVDGDKASQLQIRAMDEPGAGGANHSYLIEWDQTGAPDSDVGTCYIHFQEGTIKENGVNGVTQEALLAIVIDRLRSFQGGPFSNPYNQVALDNCERALLSLQQRTLYRISRGIEGTNQK